jgi:hypothetical protein
MQRKYPFNADAEANLADRHGLANAAVLACNANSLESLETLLITFLNADVHAQRVARLKARNIFPYLCIFDNV